MKQHNVDNLTPEQVGVAEGWRLLDEHEIYGNAPYLHVDVDDLEGWCHFWSTAPGWRGSNHGTTYRTKLTREELRKARGLDAAITTTKEVK